MTKQERKLKLIDLLDSYGIHSKMISKDIVKKIEKIYEQYDNEVDNSKELPY